METIEKQEIQTPQKQELTEKQFTQLNYLKN